MGRRVEKKVFQLSTGNFQLTKSERFVYDSYKLIEKLDANNNNVIVQKFTWQPNGVGFDVPLSVAAVNGELGTVNYYYQTDANKNIGQLVDGSGNIVAKYEYSPFGKITAQSGAYADANPFRFSSEYFDAETGLVYYNYRYYSPECGRWIKRDMIVERGGYNLYVIYNFINKTDYLGLFGDEMPDPSNPGSSFCPYNPTYMPPGVNPNNAHQNRNKMNKCPYKIPGGKKCREYKKDDKFDYGNGNSYLYEGRPFLHGRMQTFRGVGENNLGSQCSYDDNGNLVDSGPFQGTYDYAAPYGKDGIDYLNVPLHFIKDVLPHFFDPNYTPNQTTIICR